ncbi:MAG: hypothetical protein JXA64_00830 [Candidatus Fermentibacteraceae bacterium]|nr:hypothetical protein [Candidatus Fermentibacteraceae bacterium]
MYITNSYRIMALGVFTASLALLRGPSLLAGSACLLTAGLLTYRGVRIALVAALFLGGLSLMARRPSAMAALLITGSMIAMAGSDRIISRVLILASTGLTFASGALDDLLPLVPAVLAAAFLPGARRRGAVEGAGLVLMLLAAGLPAASDRNVARGWERIEGGTAEWTHDEPLDLATPVLVLDAGEERFQHLSLTMSAGGTRDRLPVGMVVSGDSTLPVMPGDNTLEIDHPDFPVTVLLTREWKPFNHPVIHFIRAEAGVERAD